MDNIPDQLTKKMKENLLKSYQNAKDKFPHLKNILSPTKS
jgi:hypothetical protein